MKTKRGDFTFVVKEGPGQAFIVAEPTSDLPGMKGLIGFDLKPDTSLDEANELARAMRKHIRGLSIT